MNLRFRLNLIVTVVLLIILMISVMLAINTARENVRAEVESAMKFAKPVLKNITEDLAHKSLDKQSPFNISRLHNLRHLRIDFYNNNKHLSDQLDNYDYQPQGTGHEWFRALMYQSLQDIKHFELPVYSNGEKLGMLVVKPQPNTEIDEAWEETKTMLAMITLFFVVVNILVYIVVEQALKPITRITSALADVEAGNLTTRLPNFKLPELELIGHKFNLMASALEISTRDNHRLTQQIIRLQEVERKSLAQELHDEVGQHLTAIHVDACAIKRSDNLAATKKSADAIDEVVGQMVEILRSMLQRLRPGGLDNLSFIDALHQLLSNWQERHSFIELDYQIAGEFSQLDENVQLTLYRVIQECLTNISRHAQANQVNLSLVNANQQITLDVVDNGRGYNPSQPSPHFGIAGMKERIASVNGDIRIQTELKQGVALTVTIPNQRGTK